MPERNEKLRSVGRIARSAMISGTTQGPARAAERALERASAEAMAFGAEKVAMAAQRRLLARKRKQGQLDTKKAPKKKMTGIAFYMMLSLTIFKDLFDIILTFTIILSFLGVLFGLLVTFIVLIYYFFNHVNLTSRKLVIFVASMAIEILPFVGVLPMASFSLILVRSFENSDRLRKFAEGKVGGAMQVAT